METLFSEKLAVAVSHNDGTFIMTFDVPVLDLMHATAVFFACRISARLNSVLHASDERSRRPRNEADSRSVVHEQSVNHHIFLNKKQARCYARVPTHCAGASYSY